MRSDIAFEKINLLSVMALVLWIGCACVAVAGHYLVDASPAAPGAPVVTKMINVTLTDASAVTPPSEIAHLPATPVVPQFVAPHPAPVPSNAMAMPVKSAPSNSPQYQRISYGSGEGAQPKPDYPIEAQLDGQEGTVVIRFVVGLDGSVTSTQVIKASPWPLLNQAAARSIRETWTYPPGAVRHYEVSITYRRKTN